MVVDFTVVFFRHQQRKANAGKPFTFLSFANFCHKDKAEPYFCHVLLANEFEIKFRHSSQRSRFSLNSSSFCKCCKISGSKILGIFLGPYFLKLVSSFGLVLPSFLAFFFAGSSCFEVPGCSSVSSLDFFLVCPLRGYVTTAANWCLQYSLAWSRWRPLMWGIRFRICCSPACTQFFSSLSGF